MKKLIIISALMFASTLTFSQTTVNIEPPTDDAYIYQGNPNNNYGSSPNLAVGYAGGSEMRMLIKWNLSSLPNCINITDAQIRLYQTTTNTSITADIERINGAWSELSVTWNNQPNTIGWYGSQTFSSTSGVKYIPATDLVNDWLTYGNNGVMFKINIGSSYQMFDSKEASGSDPRLIITYTLSTPPSAIISSKTDENCGNCDGTATVNVSGGISPYTYNWSTGQTTTTISGLCAGNYSVTVTDANGCTDVATTTINNISGPSVSSTSTNTTCGNNNGSVSANATGGTIPYSYLWSNGCTASTCNNLNSGTYSVTVTDNNGCTATGSSSVNSSTFTINPTNINVNYNSGNTSFLINTSGIWSVSESCSWLSASPTSGANNGTITITYNANTSTNSRSCTITVSCGASSEIVTINQDSIPPTSIKETTAINNFNIYPNPNTGKFVIEISKIENLEIKLLNVLGQIIYYQKHFADKIEIDLSEYSEGIYFLNIETEKGIARRKILVVK